MPIRAGLLLLLAAAAACATLPDTPAQRRAWDRWTDCRPAVPNADLVGIDPDGRLRVQILSGFDRDRLLACLHAPGPGALPEPLFIGPRGGP